MEDNTQVTKNKGVISNRDKTLNRLKSKYPDKEFADDESMYGQINDDIDGYDQKLNEMEGREKTFSDLFTSDPRSAHFFQTWRNGGDPLIALVETFGDEFSEALNDPEKQEELAKARNEYLKKTAKAAENDKEYKANLKKSLELMEQYKKENGMSEDEVDKLIEEIVTVVDQVVMGKFEQSTLDLFRKASNYDADVTSARQEGEIKGRNTKIEEKLKKHDKGDGMPQLGGPSQTSSPKSNSIFDLASQV